MEFNQSFANNCIIYFDCPSGAFEQAIAFTGFCCSTELRRPGKMRQSWRLPLAWLSERTSQLNQWLKAFLEQAVIDER